MSSLSRVHIHQEFLSEKNSSFTFPSINPLSGTNVVAIRNLSEEERNVSTLRVTRFLNVML